jgi:hypothetical protein
MNGARDRRGTAGRLAALVLAPALLAGAAYAVWFGLPLRTAAATSREQAAAIGAQLPTADSLRDLQARASSLRAELAAAEAERGAKPVVSGRVVSTAERAAWRQFLSDALSRNRLVLLQEERVDVDLPPSVARSLLHDAGTSRLRTHAWRVRLTGTYLDLLRALGELRQSPMPFHLLEIDLRRDAQGRPSCTLLLC